MKKLFLLLIIISGFEGYSQKTLSLKDCMDYAIQNNIQIQQSALSSDINANSLEQYKYSRYPDLSGSVSHGYNWAKQTDVSTNDLSMERAMSQNFSLNSSVVLFNGLRIVNNIKKGNYDLNASKEETERLKYELRLSIASAYLQILYNEENSAIAIKNLDNIKLKREKISKQIEVGRLPQSEILNIDAEIANVETDLVNTESNIQLAYLNLKILMNYKEADNFLIKKADTSTPIEDNKLTMDYIVEQAVKEHPEIKLAENRINSSLISIDLAKSAYYPILSLRGSIGSGYSSVSKVIDNIYNNGEKLIGYTAGNENVYAQNYGYDYKTKSYGKQIGDNLNTSVGFYLSIPIFDAFKVKYDVSRYKIEKNNAELSLLNSRDNIRKDIMKAYTDMITARKKLDASLKGFNASKEAYSIINQKYDNGVVNFYEFNDANLRLLKAESELLKARYDILFTHKVIQYYMGQPFEL